MWTHRDFPFSQVAESINESGWGHRVKPCRQETEKALFQVFIHHPGKHLSRLDFPDTPCLIHSVHCSHILARAVIFNHFNSQSNSPKYNRQQLGLCTARYKYNTSLLYGLHVCGPKPWLFHTAGEDCTVTFTSSIDTFKHFSQHLSIIITTEKNCNYIQ